jgi:hypothetical protein
MSYIGRGVDAISNVSKLTNLTFNGGTTYALVLDGNAFTPVGANNILISIDGVIQQGNFSVSTTNIVFDWSPTSSNTCNFILHYGTGVLNVPADGSIVAAKMAANSVDSDSYVDASIDNAHLADDAVGVAELSATGTASSSTFLRGDNAWAAAGGDNTPSFLAYRNSTQAVATTTNTIMVFNTEAYDGDSAYDTTNGRFTVPSGEGGKYFFTASYVMAGMGDGTKNSIALWKNGSAYAVPYFDYDSNSPTASTALYNRIIGILTLSAADYVQVNMYQNTGGSINIAASQNHFGGYKLIGI